MRSLAWKTGLLALSCNVVVVLAAHAQALRDPTRPPDFSAAAPEVEATVSALQSVLISPGRRVAVISGRTVAVGDQVGNAKVISIREGEVVLREGGETRTLKLFPNIEKHASARGQTGSRAASGK
jgi:MSHA biogenesis protein MshK